ncbi:MAG: phosphotransferase family protein [Pseudomonadota bacterium]
MNTQTINTVSLENYLAGKLPGFEGSLVAEKYPGGQSNPTFLLSSGTQRWVLRRKPPGDILSSAHAVDREFQVLGALASSDVPVAQVHLFCDDKDVIGSMFYLMEHLGGRVFWDPQLPEVSSRQERAAIYDEMNRVLAAIHAVETDLIGLDGYGKPGNYIERQIGRWIRQYRASETTRCDAMEQLIRWLPEHLPSMEERISLVHGDFKIDNLMFHKTEARVIGVLDWELSTLGDPIADLAYLVMTWQLGKDDQLRGLDGVDRVALGLPTDEAFISRYCDRAGIDSIAHWEFYLAFCFFRSAAILQGVHKRTLVGTASSNDSTSWRSAVERFASLGLLALEKQSLP